MISGFVIYVFVKQSAEKAHILMKVETHNHPTGICPAPGAMTGIQLPLLDYISGDAGLCIPVCRNFYGDCECVFLSSHAVLVSAGLFPLFVCYAYISRSVSSLCL